MVWVFLVMILLRILEKMRLNLHIKKFCATGNVSYVFPNRIQMFSSICFELSNAEYVI